MVAGPARRSIDRIPTKVAGAVLDFMVGPLIENPHRVGKPLRGELAGLHSARVGTYRVVYEISEEDHVVRVLYIDHRADVYRPR
jgi:mRNA-degrading endonuclease RelE of RelBE toxin-antitoxin system